MVILIRLALTHTTPMVSLMCSSVESAISSTRMDIISRYSIPWSYRLTIVYLHGSPNFAFFAAMQVKQNLDHLLGLLTSNEHDHRSVEAYQLLALDAGLIDLTANILKHLPVRVRAPSSFVCAPFTLSLMR